MLWVICNKKKIIKNNLPSFVIITESNPNHLPKKHNIYKRDAKNFDRNDFVLDLLEIDWDNIINTESCDPNKSFNSFYESINKLLDKHMPLKKVTKREHKMKFKPWITNYILNKIKVKNKLFNSYITRLRPFPLINFIETS